MQQLETLSALFRRSWFRPIKRLLDMTVSDPVHASCFPLAERKLKDNNVRQFYVEKREAYPNSLCPKGPNVGDAALGWGLPLPLTCCHTSSSCIALVPSILCTPLNIPPFFYCDVGMCSFLDTQTSGVW